MANVPANTYCLSSINTISVIATCLRQHRRSSPANARPRRRQAFKMIPSERLRLNSSRRSNRGADRICGREAVSVIFAPSTVGRSPGTRRAWHDLTPNPAPLELAFDSKPIRAICESASQAEAEFGAKAAEALHGRLADLRAAVSLEDLPVARPRLLRDDDPSVMVMEFSPGHQLIFRVNHPRPPKTKSGSVDWTNVSRIKLLAIQRNDL